MRRSAFFLAVLILLLSLTGCLEAGENSYSFYYLRVSDTIAFGQADALVAPVAREISGQSADLNYLLQLYFEGPTEEGFHSPFPQGTRLIKVKQETGLLVLEVTSQFTGLENIRLTLAGACLAATCHALAAVDSVQVICGNEVYTFCRNDYTFLDSFDTESGKDMQ